MWEAIAEVLTNENAIAIVLLLFGLFLILVFLAKKGYVRLNVGKFALGDDYRERAIIQQQAEWAHIYCQGLKPQVDAYCKDIEGYDTYITMYMLERMYSEVVEWITYNHINLDSDYISIKQDRIKALLASLTVMPQVFTSPKFSKQVDAWTDELIRKLVKIREVYK